MVSEQRQRDPSASVRPSVPLSSESMLVSKAFLPLSHPLTLGHISHCHTSSLSPGTRPPLGTPPPSCWVCTQNHRAGVQATEAEDMLFHLAKASLPSPLGRHRAGGHPGTLRRANRRKQTKNGGEPSGPEEEEGRGSPGQGVHLMYECIRPGKWERARGGQGSMRGGQSGGRERAVREA